MEGHGQPRTNNGPALAGSRRRSSPRCDRIVDHAPNQAALPVAHLGPGSEMAEHTKRRIYTSSAIYLCDPQGPWQRSINENSNDLLRQ